MTTGESRWTIAELGERVCAALADGAYEPPSNGQVRAVPDLRTIRYYTSIGLLDRPAAMRGRTALYSHRHLLQLVAVKRLQAEGKSLTGVQSALAGLDDEGLAAIARVSADAEPTGVAEDKDSADEAPPREARFWAAAPARAVVARSEAARLPAKMHAAPAGVSAAPGVPAAAVAPVAIVARVALAPGVSLLIEAAGVSGEPERIAGAIDAFDLVRAAAPLLEELRRRGLALGDEVEEEETE